MMTNSTHANLATPPMSWLRKMSENTMISSQIQMKNIVNQIIDQKTWPTAHSEPSIPSLPLLDPPSPSTGMLHHRPCPTAAGSQSPIVGERRGPTRIRCCGHEVIVGPSA